MEVVKAEHAQKQTQRTEVTELKSGRRARTVLLVTQKKLQLTRAGKPYLALQLSDRSGSISARMWDDAELYAGRFDDGDLIYVDGLVETFKGSLQLKLTKIERVPNEHHDLGDFVPASIYQPTEMLADLVRLVETEINHRNLRRFLLALLADEEVSGRLKAAPAAKVNHHAYLAGLLEHTRSMCQLALAIGNHYRAQYGELLATELLLAGALLHDIGKLWELSSGPSISYTDEGQLIGHIVIGVELITRLFRELEIDDTELALRLKHMVLSHHGLREYGAVVEPKTPEAQILHYIDQIDARMNMAARAVGGADGRWSAYISPLRTSIYLGDRLPKEPLSPTVNANPDNPPSPVVSSPARQPIAAIEHPVGTDAKVVVGAATAAPTGQMPAWLDEPPALEAPSPPTKPRQPSETPEALVGAAAAKNLTAPVKRQRDELQRNELQRDELQRDELQRNELQRNELQRNELQRNELQDDESQDAPTPPDTLTLDLFSA